MDEDQIRLAAFQWLQEQTRIHGEVLHRSILEKGFYHNGERVTVIGPAGIWKPRVFSAIPLSITTVTDGPYDDSFTSDGFLSYAYRGTDPQHRDNVGLRKAMARQTPLIYFHSVVKGRYLAVWPVFIINDAPQSLSFTVAADDQESLVRGELFCRDGAELLSDSSTIAKRSYITSIVRRRLHQKSFRERVLEAYSRQCALCHLRHAELLDAAHIIPDRDSTGDPVVQNGISLCKIHHAAFDSNIIGITPEYKVAIREDILVEIDGPMLRYGIQELHGQRVLLPRRRHLWPDRERIEERYRVFGDAG